MNKGWRNLLIIGVLALLFTVGWEIYQTNDGGRDDFNPFVNVLDRSVLFPVTLENHIKNGAANIINSDAVVSEEDEFAEVEQESTFVDEE